MTTITTTALLTGEPAYCTDCHGHITATRDDYGVWIECDCDAGYMQGNRIRVLS